jgi:membrane protein DedA with SNARE-associated domain
VEDFLFGLDPLTAYLAITLLMISTGAGNPLPEETFIIAAGVASTHPPGDSLLNPWWALLCLLFGALAGDAILYWIGYHFGRSVMREHRWWARFVTPEREAQMEESIRRHGLKVLFLARFLVGLRSPVYLTTGILRVPFRRFLLYDLLCATIVIGTFFTLSYVYGEAIYNSIRQLEVLVTVVVVLAATAVGIRLWRHHRRRQAETEAANRESTEPSGQSDDEVDKMEHVA